MPINSSLKIAVGLNSTKASVLFIMPDFVSVILRFEFDLLNNAK